MSEIRRFKKLPHLSEYMVQDHARCAPIRSAFSGLIGGLGFATWLGLSVGTFFFTKNWAATIGMSLCMYPVVVGIIFSGIDSLVKKPRTAEERRLAEVRAAIADFGSRKNLAQDMDYGAAQLLEASASAWIRIHTALGGAPWKGETAPHHLQSAAKEMIEASDEAMREAILLSRTCLAKKGERRSSLDDIKDDLEDLDFRSVLDGLRTLATDSRVYQSPNRSQVFEPMREIAERLNRLAREVEETTSGYHVERQVRGTGPVARLESSLEELRLIKAAEQELTVAREELNQERL